MGPSRRWLLSVTGHNKPRLCLQVEKSKLEARRECTVSVSPSEFSVESVVGDTWFCSRFSIAAVSPPPSCVDEGSKQRWLTSARACCRTPRDWLPGSSLAQQTGCLLQTGRSPAPTRRLHTQPCISHRGLCAVWLPGQVPPERCESVISDVAANVSKAYLWAYRHVMF